MTADLNAETNETPTRDERTRRGLIGLAVIATLLVLILWWIWLQTAIVPDVVGMNEAQGRIAIEEAGFLVGEVRLDRTALRDPGLIDDQGIPGGRRAMKGQEIDLFVAEVPDDTDGPDRTGNLFDPDAFDSDSSSIRDRGAAGTEPGLKSPRSYTGVPRVLNLAESAAVSTLRTAGLSPVIKRSPNSGGIAPGRVFYQIPAPNDDPTGSTVEIWVSTGAPTGGLRPEPNKPADYPTDSGSYRP